MTPQNNARADSLVRRHFENFGAAGVRHELQHGTDSQLAGDICDAFGLECFPGDVLFADLCEAVARYRATVAALLKATRPARMARLMGALAGIDTPAAVRLAA